MFPVNVTGEAVATDRIISTRSAGGGAKSDDWYIPEEVPIAFVFNRRNYAVMLATPSDLVDFAVGFSLTERVIEKPSDILSLDIQHGPRGVDYRIKISGERLDKLDLVQRRRNLIGSASCGLCGLDNADTLFEKLPIVSKPKASIDGKIVIRAFDALASHQPINARTHSVHAAAWSNMDGDILALREDVGRHNALDKLLGALALEDTNMLDGFVVMSSRCSYELVEKAARRGVRALATISGPTGFAVQKAREANMAIYARGQRDAVELIF